MDYKPIIALTPTLHLAVHMLMSKVAEICNGVIGIRCILDIIQFRKSNSFFYNKFYVIMGDVKHLKNNIGQARVNHLLNKLNER